jgi:hydrocephalus-inducing protein
MTIDIEGVGNDMLSVPIKGDCQVPVVDITPSEKVEFAEACLNYPETKTIILNNHSDIKAKFSIIPQSEESKVLAKYTVAPEAGIIDEKASKELQITLVTSKLG